MREEITTMADAPTMGTMTGGGRRSGIYYTNKCQATSTNPAGATCMNIQGGYTCVEITGFNLQPDGYTLLGWSQSHFCVTLEHEEVLGPWSSAYANVYRVLVYMYTNIYQAV